MLGRAASRAACTASRFDPPVVDTFAFMTRRNAHLSPATRAFMELAAKRAGGAGPPDLGADYGLAACPHEHATVAEEEYLQTIFWLQEAGLPMTGANVARAMQLSAPTVHEMIGRLERDGYITRGDRQARSRSPTRGASTPRTSSAATA